MLDIQDYPSRMNDADSKKFEALSYLPPMDDAGIRVQLAIVAERGHDIVVEHVEPVLASDSHWYMWKLPMFGERDVNVVMAEAEACAKANPGHHVRVSAIDRYRQTMDFSLVVRRAE